MAVLARFIQGSGLFVRRFGVEVAVSMAALLIVAFGVSRALPSADPSRFDRGDPAWVGQLAKEADDAPLAAAPPTSASLTVPPATVALVLPPTEPAEPVRQVRPPIATPVRRPKLAEQTPAPIAPLAARPMPVAATQADFFSLATVTRHLPSPDTLMRPFDAVGNTVASFFRRP